MADTYEQNLGQKSSLTMNDFIRVVGSDNVSYKQRLSDVNKTIPLNTVSGLTTEALIDQAYNTAHTETPNEMLYRRLIYHGFAHSILGGGVFYLEGYRASSSYGWQRVTSYGNPTRVFIRSINNDTWTTWAKEPTRAEIDALNSKTTGTTTNINPESALTIVGGGLGSYAEKYGQVVHFISMVKLTDPNSALENGTVVFRLPSGLRPSRFSLIEARQFSRTGGTVGYGYIKPDGEVYLSQGGIEANAGNIVFEAFYLSAQ